MKDLQSMLDRWSQTGEFRHIPSDEFMKIVLEAQKDGNAAYTALCLCCRRYKEGAPPKNLIQALMETPISIMSVDSLYWAQTVQLYLDKHKISAKHGCTLILKAVRANCLQNVFGKMLETNQAKMWEALVLAIKQASKGDLVSMMLQLRKCRNHFTEEAISHIHELVQTREQKVLAPRVAQVLPNDLPVALQWMSLYEKQKTDVAVSLLKNMGTEMGEPQDIQYYQSRLDDVYKAWQEAEDVAKAWLDLYQAQCHYEVGEMLCSRGNEIFKIGLVETAAEKKAIDNLEVWLEDPNTKIAGKEDLLQKLHKSRDGKRRKSGNVWHTRLTKALYESNRFESVGVEQKVSGKKVDILLEDEHGKDIHIEAWNGVTEMSYRTNRTLQIGERFNINNLGRCGDEDGVFEWKYALKWLNGKIKQLPPTGRNFVIAQRPYNELVWQNMDGVDLKDNICVMQVMPPRVLVGCKNNERMAITVQLISESLDCTIM